MTDSRTLYVISRDGQGSGGFLCPPGHPNLEYVVYQGSKANPSMIAGLDYLITAKYGDVPDSVKARAEKIMADAQLTCSERWVRMVYGYFRNSYAPESGSRNVSDAVSTSKLHCNCGAEFWPGRGLDSHLETMTADIDTRHFQVFPPPPPPERHLGYLTVHDFFPEHAPRLDLIADPGKGYGAYPCAKCGQRVQYEARKDALCVVRSGSSWSYDPVCPKGGGHLLEGETGTESLFRH